MLVFICTIAKIITSILHVACSSSLLLESQPTLLLCGSVTNQKELGELSELHLTLFYQAHFSNNTQVSALVLLFRLSCSQLSRATHWPFPVVLVPVQVSVNTTPTLSTIFLLRLKVFSVQVSSNECKS